MESRSYMFSTAKKRSTLLESRGIEYFPLYPGFPGRPPPHPASLSARRNAQTSTASSWSASRPTARTPRSARPSRRSSLSAADPRSGRRTPTSRTPIDDKQTTQPSQSTSSIPSCIAINGDWALLGACTRSDFAYGSANIVRYLMTLSATGCSRSLYWVSLDLKSLLRLVH